jgi:hypothetical protein
VASADGGLEEPRGDAIGRGRRHCS